MKRYRRRIIIIFLIVVVAVVFLYRQFLSNESVEVDSFTYEIEENDQTLIIDLSYQITNHTKSKKYATIKLDAFFYPRVMNPESIEPISFQGNLSGGSYIIINKEHFTRDFIESVKSKERNPISTIIIGDEIEF